MYISLLLQILFGTSVFMEVFLAVNKALKIFWKHWRKPEKYIIYKMNKK